MIKYSIVIPTWNKYNELLKPCLDSLLKNTSREKLKETEIIIVANGCKDDTFVRVQRDFRTSFNLVVIEYPEAIGYTRATNAGIKEAKGEFLVLLNNDCVILDFAPNDEWINSLEKPFVDNSVGVTGVKKLYSHQAKSDFLVFFLVMIKKSTIDTVGYLDEIFSPGGGEDIDFCLRLKKYGLRYVKVPTDDNNYEDKTEYPIFHAAEKTVFDVIGWEEGFWKRMAIIEHRTNSFYYEEFADVTAYVSTKGRYTTTLPSCLISIANQTLKPKRLIIFQDDPESFNMEESTIYKNILFGLLTQKGIEWSVVFGEGKGQVVNHQKALDLSTTEWIWRIDDDNVAEPNVLEGLCKNIDKNVGAIAPAVLDPLYTPSQGLIQSTMIEYINVAPNWQWSKNNPSIGADHLYSTFLYRREAGQHGYNKDLSPVGHREETLFTYEMKRNGWSLLIDTSIVTWHLRETTGGIRSFSDNNLWEKDEKVFSDKMEEWGVKMVNIIPINMDNGIGDHWIFKPVLEKILKNNVHDLIVVAACYPDVFEDIKKVYNNLILISVVDGHNIFGKEKMEALSIYGFCDSQKWDKHIQKAFEKLYS